MIANLNHNLLDGVCMQRKEGRQEKHIPKGETTVMTY